jgi:cytochrome P450
MKFTTFISVLTFTLSSVSAFAPSDHIASSMATKGDRSFVGPLNGRIEDDIAPILDKTTKFSGGVPYQRKCPFVLPQDRVKINNMPSIRERVPIRTFHFLQRKLVQWGALKSWNPIVKLLSLIFYAVDLAWAGIDKEYYIKRKAIFGPTFISTLSVVLSKYDKNSKDKDSLDARLLTYPQRREFFLGSTIMNPETSYFFGEKSRKHKFGKSLISLFVSDPGATINPSLPSDQPNHSVLRDFYTKNWLSEDKMNAAIKRQTDEIGTKLLNDFAQEVKGKSNSEDLNAAIDKFLPVFLIYTIFDVPLDKIPIDIINESVCSGGFVLNLYGPNWIAKLTPLGKNQKAMREKTNAFVDFLSEHSVVLRDIQNGPGGLSKKELCESIAMIFGIAGFNGTRSLAKTSMTQMPKDYQKEVANDPIKLVNAILECARMDTPVTGAHQIVDDKDGLTTEIGGKKMTFPRGTILFTAMTIANVDEDRFPDPFVFDPETRDFGKLTSFNSVGEDTYDASPRICPGRNFAVMASANMIRVKHEAEAS